MEQQQNMSNILTGFLNQAEKTGTGADSLEVLQDIDDLLMNDENNQNIENVPNVAHEPMSGIALQTNTMSQQNPFSVLQGATVYGNIIFNMMPHESK